MKKNNHLSVKKRNYVIISIVLITVLFFTLRGYLPEVINQMKTLNVWWLLLALAFTVVYGLLRTAALHLIIKDIKKDMKFKDTTKNMMKTGFINGVTPFSSGGQPAHVYFLTKQNISVGESTSIVVQNFIVYQLVLMMFGFTTLALNKFYAFFPNTLVLRSFIILGFTVNSIVLIVLFLVGYYKSKNNRILKKIIGLIYKLKLIKDKDKAISKINKWVSDFSTGAASIRKNKLTFVKCLILNFLGFMFFFTIPLIILFSTGDFTSLTVITSVVASSHVMLMGAFIPIPGGAGGLEYGFARFFGNFIGGPVLSTVLLLWRFLTYYLVILAGGILLLAFKRKTYKS